MPTIRLCRENDRSAILAIVNAAAEAYRHVIPPGRWHEPYMTLEELESEIASGVMFWGFEADGALQGVMGMQSAGDVDLIRHAYVRPAFQGRGVGSALICHLRRLSTRRMLVGTWADAVWAIQFYQRHGFQTVSQDLNDRLLETYWTIPARQVETSVVLTNPPLPDA